MSGKPPNEIEPDVYDELVVEARTHIDPDFALVRKIVESAYREMGARTIRGLPSDNATPDFSLRIPGESTETMESFNNRPA